MKQQFKRYSPGLLVIGLVCGMASCKKTDSGGTTPPPPTGGGTTNTDTTLKLASSVPIGLAIDYTPFKNVAAYKNVVATEADNVTFGYNMKHGAIVRDDGSFDYSRADELFNLATAAGVEVFGHTLAWHENQNGNYLRSLTVGGPDTTNNLLTGGDFEAGTGTTGTGTTLFTGWNLLIGGTAAAGFAAVPGNGSARALQATVTTAGANAYDVQAIGPAWTATVGRQYKVYVDVKASAAGGTVRLVNQNAQYQQSDVSPTTSWATYSWTLTAAETSPMIRLNFPTTGVYTVDNVRIYDATTGTALTPAQIATAVDTALSRFIRSTVTRYAGRIKAWDAVNESISDGSGKVRTNTGTTTGDRFYWSQYLGRDFALKAFQYAKAADPAALLFINDYNIESDNTKLDSLLAYVNELKAKGASIDGIGTQMHISINTSQTGIDNMFRKLAATGLKVRISELDVRINPANAAGFSPTTALFESQAAMYKYVVQSYLKNVPKAQQHGITVWGITDDTSWLYNNGQDYPLLFNANYTKKPAYTAVLQALKGQ